VARTSPTSPGSCHGGERHLGADDAFLAEPLNSDDLARRVRTMLDGESSAQLMAGAPGSNTTSVC
jgi:hypothetical protein